jgi:hypothetical protein
LRLRRTPPLVSFMVGWKGGHSPVLYACNEHTWRKTRLMKSVCLLLHTLHVLSVSRVTQ